MIVRMKQLSNESSLHPRAMGGLVLWPMCLLACDVAVSNGVARVPPARLVSTVAALISIAAS